MGVQMLGRRVLWVLGLTACLGAAEVGAGTIDGREWPPDPKRYDPPGTEVAPGLKVGDTLDSTNAQTAKDLLPPEVLKHFETNEYVNPIVSWPLGIIHHDQSYEAATKENEGKYSIDPKTGTILEKSTGEPPTYVYGTPFPNIDPSDPEGGVKALWNQFHGYWNTGSYNFNALIVWTSPTGVERQSLQDVYFQYYENQAPKYRVENGQNFSWQSLAAAKTPADLQGTVALSYRYRDPTKRDALWTYVPALRRVRAVSPANRSDGFLGSDLSQDDGNFFDAKPEDFKWKTVGIKEGLRFVDPDSVKGDGGELKWVPSGGWRQEWTRGTPAAGFQKEGWKGLGWAPVSAGLAKRKFWVVEGTPEDRYYLYGKVELWIDTESWIGSFNRKFSWKGEVLNTYQVNGYLNHPAVVPDSEGGGYEWFWSSQHAWQCAEALKHNRATLAGLRSDLALPFDRRVKHPTDQLFDVATLSRFGK
jgi:hypothetical protein